MRDASESLLKVDALMVTATARRDGVGTALMEAAEAWGTARGATRAVGHLLRAQPDVRPVLRRRMGYTRATTASRSGCRRAIARKCP